jgi:hypothetical protein
MLELVKYFCFRIFHSSTGLFTKYNTSSSLQFQKEGREVPGGSVQLFWKWGELFVCEVWDFMMATMKTAIWRDVTPYSPIEVYQLLRNINEFLMSILRHISGDSSLQNFINSLLFYRFIDLFSQILIQLFIILIVSLTKDHLSIHLSPSPSSCLCMYVCLLLWLIDLLIHFKSRGARGRVVGWGTMLQAGRSRDRVSMRWIFSNLPNPSGRTMAMGLTQPLTEMSTRNLKKKN